MLRIDLDAVKRMNIRAQAAVHREVKKQVGVTMRRFVGEHVKAKHRGGDGLYRRTGALARSFKSHVDGDSIETIKGVAFSEGVPYAAIHEFGGVIKPKRRQWLTIPLDIVKTPAGVPRYTAAEVISNPGIGGFDSTFFRRSKKGNLILFALASTGLVPLFVLRKQVTIKATMGFRQQWEDRMKITASEIQEAYGRGLAKPAQS